MLNKVSISVIISCANLEKYLDECIASIAAQTMQPTEVIVIHDNCNEPRSYKNVTSVFRQVHKGVARTRQEGVLLATSDNILFLDADDALSENFIEAMVHARIVHPIAILYPNVLLWSHWGDKEKQRNGWHEAPDKIDYKMMYEKCPLVITSLIPQNMCLMHPFDPKLKLYEDWQFWFELFTVGEKFIKVPGAVLKYRQRQKSRNRADPDLRNQMFYEVQGRHLSPEEYEKIHL